MAIDSNGNVMSSSAYAVTQCCATDFIPVSSEFSYELTPTYNPISSYLSPRFHALYDENQTCTRVIPANYNSTIQITPAANEKYMRITGGTEYYGQVMIMPTVTQIGPVVETTLIPSIGTYPNVINTIDILTTVKPSSVLIEATPDEEDPDDPSAAFTGIIYNEGVLDVTQEDPNALNELTIHFRESDKVITVPAGGSTYTAGDGIDIDANDEISVKLGAGLQFDANGAIEAPGGVEYVAGDGINIDYASYDPDYYFDTQVSCKLSGNRLVKTFTKYNSEPAFGAVIWHYNNEPFSGPVFVGRTVDSVKCTGNTTNVNGPITFDGKQWYYSTLDGWVDGQHTDDLGNMQTIEHLYPIAEKDDAALAILTAAYAGSNSKAISIKPATTETIGGVIVGGGLEIDEDGVLSAPGGRTYVAGDGIVISDNTSYELSEDTVTNTEYFFDTQVTSTVSGRTYTKYNTEPALGAVVYASSYTQPFFVGLTADSVKYGTSYDSQIWPNPDHPSFEYKGVTWYYSGFEYSMSGDGTDASGHMQKLSGTYSVSTEADLQNIAKAIIDAADIITDPTKRISAKLGNGLSFDNNAAITVDEMTGATALANGASGTVPAPLAGDDAKFLRGDGSWAEIETPATYVEGDAIEFGHPGMTDLGFDFDTFVSKFTSPNNGIVSVDSVNKAFTLTATGSDCYTNPWVSGSLYTIPVIGGRKYRLTWNSNASNVDGTIYAFENANTSHMHAVNQADQNYLEFTADTSSNVNFRFGVTNSGNSITYSNIKFYEVDNADPDTNIINVKIGNGLTFDSNNAIEAIPYVLPTASASTLGGIKVGSGLSIDSSTGVLSATGSTYAFREGTTIGAFEVQENGGAWQQIAVHSVGTSLSKGNGLTSTEPPDKIYLMSASNTPLSNITIGLLDPIIDSQQQVTGWKIKETYLPSYVDDVIEGYYYNNQFYEDDQHTTVITPESGKIYIDIPNNESYRWGGTTYVMISNPVDVFHGADGTNPGTAGLVPAPLATDNTKFLKGDGTWAAGYTHPTYTPHTLGIYKIAVDSTGHVNTAQNVESTDIENLLGHIVIYCSDDVSDGIQLGTPVDAPVAANKTLSSVKENDLTILEV